MKKAILSTLILLVAVSLGYANKSKEYKFTHDVLQSLHSLDLAKRQLRTETEDVSEGMKSYTLAKENLSAGKSLMQEYMSDSQKKIAEIAANIANAFDRLIWASDEWLALAKRQQAGEAVDETEEFYDKGKEVGKQEDWAYKLIAITIPTYLPDIFAEDVKVKNPKAKIRYKLSKTERKKLISEIDSVFADELKAYYRDPKEGNEISYSVDYLKKRLKAETYGDLKKIQ